MDQYKFRFKFLCEIKINKNFRKTHPFTPTYVVENVVFFFFKFILISKKIIENTRTNLALLLFLL